MTTIVWFRQDLRVRDNPALAAAASRGSVVPVYILDDVTSGHWRMGAASRWWLHHSLAELSADLGNVVLLRGDPRTIVPALVKSARASAVYWNRCYEPFAIARDTALKAELLSDGIEVESFNASLLHEPWEVATRGSTPFRVFTPFWRASSAQPVAAPLRVPPSLSIARPNIGADRLDDWGLLPRHPDWASQWHTWWQPGEAGALARFDAFAADCLAPYAQLRDRPDLAASSCLSPHLHFGEISPRQIWSRLSVEQHEPEKRTGIDKLLSELGWREFCPLLAVSFSKTADRERCARVLLPSHGRNAKRSAMLGAAGSPAIRIVDAGMRQLWRTGWMHNRVRMIAASFLVKHLLIVAAGRGLVLGYAGRCRSRQQCRRAGSGWPAAAPTPHPISASSIRSLQGEKFDPEGDYVRRWVPELAALPREYIHAPFNAPADLLARCGIRLGTTYPYPIVAHEQARRAALAGYEQIRAS